MYRKSRVAYLQQSRKPIQLIQCVMHGLIGAGQYLS